MVTGGSGEHVESEGPDALSVSVAEVLCMLDGDFESVSQGVASGEVALWLGSGISFGRLAGLPGLVADVVEFVRSHIDPAEPGDPFRLAFGRILDFADDDLVGDRQVLVDLTVADWPNSKKIIAELCKSYSDVMDVRVAGKTTDFLLWTAADVCARYADESVEPDVEHLCIAMLAAEGVLPEVVTANWDGLIEKASKQLTGEETSMRVCVLKDDLRGAAVRTMLYKIHGCAVLAAHDPTVYRKHLIVRASQILRWAGAGDHSAVRKRIVGIATSRPTLMIGLSAQDYNIQAVFTEATDDMNWPWPSSARAHVFAEDKLGPAQLSVLKCVYPDSYEQSGPEIEGQSLIRSYGSALLLALLLDVLTRKLQVLVSACQMPDPVDDHRELTNGIVLLRDRAALASESDRREFVQSLPAAMSTMSGVFYGDAEGERYRPISPTPVNQLEAEPNLRVDGRSQAAVALALIGLGCRDEGWSANALSADGSIHLDNGRATSKIFFVANAGVAMDIDNSALVDLDSPDVILVHSGSVPERLPRSPSVRIGRSGQGSSRSVEMPKVLVGADDLDAIRRRFGEEALL